MPPESGSKRSSSASQTVVVCPNELCHSELPAGRGRGYCAECGEAWTRCSKCGRAISTLWQFCPTDGIPAEAWSSSLYGASPKFADPEPRTIEIGEESWTAPVSYGGYLWTISTEGNVFRLSPANEVPVLVENLGKEFGRHPFTILRKKEGGRPLLVAVGTRRVALMDPAIHKPEDEPLCSRSLPREENFVLLDDSYSSVAVSNQQVAYLKRKRETQSDPTPESERKPGDLFLAVGTRRANNVELEDEFAVSSEKACGPFVLGQRICLYTDDQFLFLDGQRLQSYPLPRDFHPVIDPEGESPFDVWWGHPPYVVFPSGAYIPGELNGVACFQFVELIGSRPKFSDPKIPEGGAYRPTSDEGLVIASRGSLKHLWRTRLSDALQPERDTQIMAGPALLTDDFEVALCQGAAKGRQLRLYPGGRERADIDDEVTPIDLFLFPGYLTLTSRLENHLEVISWPLVSSA